MHLHSPVRLERPAPPLPARVASPSDLQRWREEREAADAALARLVADRARMLISASVDALTKKDAEIATARVRAERAAAVVSDAERQAAESAAREAAKEPERRRRYAVGKKAAAEAERIMREEYGPAAAALAHVLGRLAALRPAIDAANADLPAEVVRLDPDAFRGRAAKAGHWEVRTEVVRIDADGREVTGVVSIRNGRDGGEPWATVEDGRDPPIKAETRERKVWVEPVSFLPAASLLTGTAIPGLLWDAPALWPPKR